MRAEDFWSMSFEEVNIACKGYEIRIARAKEIERLMTTILLNVHREKGTPAYNPEEFFPLCIDKESAKKRLMTKDEYINTQEFISKAKWQTT